MRFIKLLLGLAITVGLTYIFEKGLTFQDKRIPAIMPLANPVSGFWSNADTGEYKNEILHFSDLSAPVKVVWDDRMVPHIFAQNTNDALFVQGYVTAKNRYWQMDVTRRDAEGKLSEIFGKATLEKDKLRRGQGIRWAAENAVRGWKKGEGVDVIDSYVNGVNAYVKNHPPNEIALEFKLLGYEPEEWTALKTGLVVKSMALSLCARSSDIAATNTKNALGEENYNFLYPDWNPKQSPIIPTGTEFFLNTNSEEMPAIQENEETLKIKMSSIPHRQFEQADEFLGSNNWAVSGAKSASGNPILAGDPHLQLRLPNIWFEIQIHTPEFNVYGVSVPGIPGILIGFNEYIAWSETNVGHDVMDWYQMDWIEQGKSYRFDDQQLPTTMQQEEIWIKGETQPYIDTVIYTHLGPIVHSDSDHPKHDLAMRWVSHDEPDVFEFKTFLDLAKAKNYEDYINALDPYISPAQNFVFASKDGDVAITVNGRFPIKEKNQGKFVQSGNTSKNEWKGFIPKSQIPSIKNPERGFVASANQHSTDPSYPYYYNGGFEDYRGRYLNRKLAEMDKVTIQDMMDLQADNYSLQAEEALPLLLSHLDTTSLTTKENGLVKLLRKWNYAFDAEKAAPALFEVWWDKFHALAWDEMNAKGERQDFLIPEVWRTIELMEADPNLTWWNIETTSKVETLADIVTISFKEMTKELGNSVLESDFNYTKYKNFFINHTLPPLKAFHRTELPIGGTGSALNANKPGVGPSWRMVVELGDTITAYGVYPGGQSGNPTSKYYDSNLDTWAKGEYYKLKFLKSPEELGVGQLYQQSFQ